jgi:hypothetical protein
MASLVAEWTAEFAAPSNVASTTAQGSAAPVPGASGAILGEASSAALDGAVERVLKTHLSTQVVQHFDSDKATAATEAYTEDPPWCDGLRSFIYPFHSF